MGMRTWCGVAALLSSSSAFAQTGAWAVSEASGRVVIRDAARERAAQRGSQVPAGATVLTGAGARAVLVRGEDFVTVAPNSRLRVPAAEQAAGLFQMIEEWGNAVFKIKHLPKPHFGVQTPYLAAVVKGTTFSVTVNGEGTSLQVIDGAVEVATTDGGAHDLVRPGAVATITAADRYRLSVQGQNAHVIDSPQRATPQGAPAPTPAPSPAPEAAPRAAAPAADASDNRTSAAVDRDSIAWSEVSNSVIAAPIEAKPVDLGAVTGGLITGQAGPELAATNVARASNGNVEVASSGRIVPVAAAPMDAGTSPVAGSGGKSDPGKNGGTPAQAGNDKPGAGNPAQSGNPGNPGNAVEPGSSGKPGSADTAPKPGNDTPGGNPSKPGTDNSGGNPPKPGKEDPVGTPPKPGTDNPGGNPPKAGADDPGNKDSKPGADNPGGTPPAPGKEQPGNKGPGPGKLMGG
jgi:hypothetical protein